MIIILIELMILLAFSYETVTKNSDLNIEDTLMEGLKKQSTRKTRAQKREANSILPEVSLDQVKKLF